MLARTLLPCAVLFLALSRTAVAAVIILTPDVTYDWLKPNEGANLGDLIATGASIERNGFTFSSFSFSDASGIGAPVASDFWIVFSEATSLYQPQIVFYDPINPERQLASASAMGARVAFQAASSPGEGAIIKSVKLALTGGAGGSGGGEVRVTQTILGDGGVVLGLLDAFLRSPPLQLPGQPEATLSFPGQTTVTLSTLLTLNNASFVSFSAVVNPTEVPEPTSLLLWGIGLSAIAWRSRVGKRG